MEFGPKGLSKVSGRHVPPVTVRWAGAGGIVRMLASEKYSETYSSLAENIPICILINLLQSYNNKSLLKVIRQTGRQTDREREINNSIDRSID